MTKRKYVENSGIITSKPVYPLRAQPELERFLRKKFPNATLEDAPRILQVCKEEFTLKDYHIEVTVEEFLNPRHCED